MTMQEQTILGIDYGERHVGFAIKLSGTMTAVGLNIYERTEHEMLDELINHVMEKIKEYNVNVVVVGLPLTFKGKSSQQTDKTALFIHRLHKAIEIPVYESDERMTSKAVESDAHNFAAALILQGYIDREMSHFSEAPN